MGRKRIYNAMKRLEIVCELGCLETVRKMLDPHATGYTIVRDVAGCGHHGERDGDIAVVVTVVTLDHVDPILDDLLPLLDSCSGVVTLADVEVLRGEYFTPEVRNKPLPELRTTF